MRGCKNVVVSSVMEVFVRSEEYRKTYDFALLNRVTLEIRLGPTYCLRVKFADSIESDMNVVQ